MNNKIIGSKKRSHVKNEVISEMESCFAFYELRLEVCSVDVRSDETGDQWREARESELIFRSLYIWIVVNVKVTGLFL